MRRLEGAYSVVAIAEETLVAFRDPHGIRPLELGRLGDDWVVASETCAFDLDRRRARARGAPGRGRVDRRRRVCTPRRRCPPGRAAICIFEHVYFARPDSRLGGVAVHAARVRMGGGWRRRRLPRRIS